MKFIISFLLILNFVAYPLDQIYNDEDLFIFKSKIEFAEKNNLKELPLNEIISAVGKSFISTPYQAHSLEITDTEELVINLRGLDCTTFLETTFAIALCIKNNQTTFENFKDYLQKIRYREEKIEDYTSRLHYFSDWIYHNQKKKLVKDVTKEMKGEVKKFVVNFMSENPHLYKHLKNNPDFIKVIRNQEKEITQRQYHYIPENKLKLIDDKIREGDLIAFTTNIRGLDISHVGIAVKGENGKTYFLHAPQVGSYVEITSEPLQQYVLKLKKHTGIIVLRVLE